MGIFDKAILISDIDGTLLYDGIIPQENIDAIEEFKKEGGLFTIATGRGVEAAEDTYYKLNCNLPAAVFHGGVVYDYQNKAALFNDSLSKQDKLIALKIFEKFSNIGVEIHSVDCLYIISHNDGLWHHVNYENMHYKEVNAQEILGENWNKIVLFCDSEQDYISLNEYYKSLNYDNCIFELTMTYQCKNGVISKAIEFYPKSVNKGNAVRFLAEKYNRIPFTIGDYYNDLELISASKYGAATKEAPEDVKKLAKHITCGVKQGAVADYIGYIKSILRGS